MSGRAPGGVVTPEEADAILIGEPTDAEITDSLLEPHRGPAFFWKTALGITGAGTLMLFAAIAYTVLVGIGVWGNQIPVGWGFGIINFVWWIGIGHAGTFISAVLLLLEQKWRTSINRFAEAMTLFAVINAAIFPLLHLGRPWFFYWLIPYPSTIGAWPNFRSALTFDVFAITTYGIVSFLFWYLGLVPDLATARDRARSFFKKRVYGIFALGWRGSVRHWRHYRIAYALLAGLATPLVVSVHSIVSLDFAIAKLPGWHATIFPPYFVVGAIFSGFAMVITLMIPARKYMRLDHVITMRHLDVMAKVLLVTGSIVAYAYLIEFFIAWYSAEPYEQHTFLVNRPFGPYAPVFWTMVICNAVVPQLFWFPRMRRNLVVLWIASILINVGMWTERFVIIVTSQQQDFLPSSWHRYAPTVVDGMIFFGTLSFFLFLFLIFLRFVPFIPISEMKELAHELRHEKAHHGGAHAGGHPR
jgi:Ni/Fe-hydrogenase subunit HybB-like protein